MSRALLLLFLFALPAVAQVTLKNSYEAKWGSQGNGGGEWTIILNQPVNLPSCIDVSLGAASASSRNTVCVNGAHGNLHVMDFGTGPFLIDDEGYVFTLWTSKIFIPEFEVRTFANGVH